MIFDCKPEANVLRLLMAVMSCHERVTKVESLGEIKYAHFFIV